tara:strand:+ start:237 stop:902 length:666 start_codon:yes stop_codon:yes gene_type:complete
MLISLLTGFTAGAIHVIAGADHMVAIAPYAIRRPRLALKQGLAWGVGHSTGVLILASIAVLAKDLVNIEKLSSFAEFLVGVTLLVVGTIAIRSSLGLNIHNHNHQHGVGREHKHMHLHFSGGEFHSRHAHASTSLGILHGIAGASHLLAVLPALALPAMGAIAYMGAYLMGSIISMCSFVLGISLTSKKIGSRLSPLLMGTTGGLSIATGVFWLHKSPFFS